MIEFTKSINANFGSPYVEVDETTQGAVRANNGNWYCTKAQIEAMHENGIFHLEFLHNSEFLQPEIVETVWSLEAWKAETNQLHNELFERMYQNLDYLSIGEIPLWFNHEDYGLEAASLKNWWQLTCALIEDVTEETAQQIAPQDFINQLPIFNVPQES